VFSIKAEVDSPWNKSRCVKRVSYQQASLVWHNNNNFKLINYSDKRRRRSGDVSVKNIDGGQKGHPASFERTIDSRSLVITRVWPLGPWGGKKVIKQEEITQGLPTGGKTRRKSGLQPSASWGVRDWVPPKGGGEKERIKGEAGKISCGGPVESAGGRRSGLASWEGYIA